MGIYHYPPPSPFIGGWQPLAPPTIAENPTTYPTPPPVRGFHPRETLLDIVDTNYNPFGNSPFITILLDTGTQPYQGSRLSPPISPAIFNPTPPSLQIVYNAWNYLLNPFLTLILGSNQEPYQDALVTPPISAPSAVNPYVSPQLLSVLNSYNPQNPFLTLILGTDEQPYQPNLLTPPISVPFFPALVANEPTQILCIISNYAVPYPIYMGNEQPYSSAPAPGIPPAVIAFEPTQLLSVLSWYNLVTQPYQSSVSFPKSSVVSNTPKVSINQNIIDSWTNPFLTLLLDTGTQPYGGTRLEPPQSSVFFNPTPPSLQAVYNAWNYPLSPFITLLLDTGTQPYQGPVGFPTSAPTFNPTPPSLLSIYDSWNPKDSETDVIELPMGGIIETIFFPPITGSLVPEAVLIAWSVQQAQLQQATFLVSTPPAVPKTPYLSPQNIYAVLDSYYPKDLEIITIELPSIMTTFVPPIIGSAVPEAVLISWDLYKYALYQQESYIVSTIPAPSLPPVGANAAASLSGRLWYSDYNPPPPTFLGDDAPWQPLEIAPVLPTPSNPPVGANVKASLSGRLWQPDYNPPPPTWIGSAQPWTPSRMADVLPVVSAPPTTGSLVPQNVLNIWNNPPQLVLIFDANTQPYGSVQGIPPSGPNIPGYLTGSVVPQAIYDAWYWIPPYVLLLDGNAEPYQGAELIPPSGPPAAQVVPPALQAIYDAWYWQDRGNQPQTVPQSIQQLASPIPPPAIQNIMEAILRSWYEQPQGGSQPRNTIAPILPIPSNPPVIGSRIPAAVMVWYIPPPESWKQLQPYTNISPTLPKPTPPPPSSRAALSSILSSWYIPPDPLPQFSYAMTVSGPAAVRYEAIFATVTVTSYGVQVTVTSPFANTNLVS